MSTVVFDISMSLDGYITAAGQTEQEPMGHGGEVLHQWAFGDDDWGREYLAAKVNDLGAVITGRRNYEHSLPWWGADGPTGDARRPVFVVTHQTPPDSPEGGVYTFVTEGIEAALRQARDAAGDATVTVMGGADLGRQYIAAGLVDEIQIHLVPVLLGGGLRMFDGPGQSIPLETVETIQTPAATHLLFRVGEKGGR